MLTGKITVQVGETALFLGESHALQFSEHVVAREGRSPVVCEPLFLPNATNLANFCDESGALNASVLRALETTRLIQIEGEFASSAVAVPGWLRLKERRFASEPLLVICLGSLDILQAIGEYPADDFVLPATPYLHAMPAGPAFADLPNALSADHATAWFTAKTATLQRGVKRLRALGVGRIAFLSIVPPTTNDDRCRRMVKALGVANPSAARLRTAFRYKAALLLNAYARQICEAEDVAFLDTWPMTTADGLGRADCMADGAHLNRQTIERILIDLVEPLFRAAIPSARSA
jgi:hypothetical protein